LLPRIEEEAPTSSSPYHQQVFWRCCRGKRRLLQGEFHTHILYFVLSFALLYFYLLRFIKNTKKLVSFVVIFTCLLLVLLEWVILKLKFILLSNKGERAWRMLGTVLAILIIGVQRSILLWSSLEIFMLV
jgi:heme/copper-type cytochrome/quinol oxidase subunit 4